jgi:hypothetical protein
MAGQAGWYRAPGEAGMLRYWNGTRWTDHRQPAPEATPQVPAHAPITPSAPVDADPMAEYERQFADPVASSFDQPTFDLDRRPFDAEPQPQYRPLSNYVPAPQRLAPAAQLAGSTVFAMGPAATPIVQSSSQRSLPAALTVDADHKAQVDPELASTAPAVDADQRVHPTRKVVLGALKGMGAGIVFIVIGLAVIGFMSANNSVGAGEITSTGIVTSLGSTADNSCTPVARFAVSGKSFTANSSVEISPCPVGLGQTVNVIYSAADPAGDARIEIGAGITPFLWLIPVLGAIVFIASLWTFILRAGSIAAGIALVRDGNKRSKKPAAAA